MAPMAGITNLPFRLVAKKMMAGLVTTEMVSAAGLVRAQKATLAYLKTNPAEQPLAVQIFGSDPDEMAAAACLAAEHGAALIDVNMGCPARKVVKTGAGSALLKDPRRAEKIVSAVRKAVTIPVTVKMRSGWSPGETVAQDFAARFETIGVDAVTLHPRFATQGFSGSADWALIRSVASTVHIPVIGNGDVVQPRSAYDMMKTTGCRGVMIGRGAVGNPWIFQQILSLGRTGCFEEPSLAERRRVILEHHRLLRDHYGAITTSRLMRGLMLWYTKRLPHSSRFRGAFTGIQDFPDLIRGLDAYFKFLQEKKR
jgi:nifR3 family TIM-barrel protein